MEKIETDGDNNVSVDSAHNCIAKIKGVVDNDRMNSSLFYIVSCGS